MLFITTHMSATPPSISPARLQSQVIDTLRFPLAIAVLFIHNSPKTTNLIDFSHPLLSSEGLFNTIVILVSHVLTNIAVPTFFIISGLLFFINIDRFDRQSYLKKIKSRTYTLFIPYILWNILPALLMVGAKLLKTAFLGTPLSEITDYFATIDWHIFFDSTQWGEMSTDWLGNHLLSTGPANLPLWFLRDLIVMTIFTPVIYFFVTRTKIYGLALLFLAYISRIWILTPGFSITAVFYFSLGAWMGINRINVVELSKRWKRILIPASLILMAACVVFDGNSTLVGQQIHPLFVFSATISSFYIASIFVERYNYVPRRLLIESCFVIYALHLLPLPLQKGFLLWIVSTVSDYAFSYFGAVGATISYLITPFICAAICILVYVALKKTCPSAAGILSGMRSNTSRTRRPQEQPSAVGGQ